MGKNFEPNKHLAPISFNIMAQLYRKAMGESNPKPGNAHFASKVAAYKANAPKPKKKTSFVLRQQAINQRYKNRGRVIA